MTFIHEYTTIRVPSIHLVFRHGSYTYIVMDYIDGQSLDHQWNTLDNTTRTSVLSQLANFMKQLRDLSNPSPRPGPIDESPCRGPWFTIYDAGPFDTHGGLVEWLNHKHLVSHATGDLFSEK